jgi:cytochrome c553
MMRKLLRASLPLTVALSLAAGFAAAEEPKTDLGRWMKPNMGAPMAGQDFDKLKESLTLVAGKPPPGNYPNWASIAKDGASAAAKQDVKGVKASCKACHDAYKKSYQDEFPDKKRPFP